MTFEDLKDAVCGETVLVCRYDIEMYFVGISNNKLITQTLDSNYTNNWREEEIKDWKIKPPERKTIQLYKTITNNGIFCLCDKEGRHPSFSVKRMGEYQPETYKKNIIKPYCKIDAETFEIIKE